MQYTTLYTKHQQNKPWKAIFHTQILLQIFEDFFFLKTHYLENVFIEIISSKKKKP